jgi:ribosome-associated protein
MTQSLHDIVINALEEVKAQDIVSIDVREFTDMMDSMIVATGSSKIGRAHV